MIDIIRLSINKYSKNWVVAHGQPDQQNSAIYYAQPQKDNLGQLNNKLQICLASKGVTTGEEGAVLHDRWQNNNTSNNVLEIDCNLTLGNPSKAL